MNYYREYYIIPILLCVTYSALGLEIAIPGQNLDKAISEAKQAIGSYLAKATPEDKNHFAQYLNYYRSEGGYQAVTPAPYVLRQSLSPDAQSLFEKLKKYAQSFVEPREPKPGATMLSQEGEKYYTTLIHFINSILKQ